MAHFFDNPDEGYAHSLGQILGDMGKQYTQQKRQQQDMPTLSRILNESRNAQGQLDIPTFYQKAYSSGVNPMSINEFSAQLGASLEGQKAGNSLQAALAKAQSKSSAGAGAKSPLQKLYEGTGRDPKSHQNLPYDQQQAIEKLANEYGETGQLPQLTPEQNEALKNAGNEVEQNKSTAQAKAFQEKTMVKNNIDFCEDLLQTTINSKNIVSSMVNANKIMKKLPWTDSTALYNVVKDNKWLRSLTSKDRAEVATTMIGVLKSLRGDFGRVMKVEIDEYASLFPNAGDSDAVFSSKLEGVINLYKTFFDSADEVQSEFEKLGYYPPNARSILYNKMDATYKAAQEDVKKVSKPKKQKAKPTNRQQTEEEILEEILG